MQTHKLNEQDIETLLLEFKKDQNTNRVANIFNITTAAVRYHLKKNNLKTKQNGEWQRKYLFKFDYFELINSQDKAYWLGFIAADGHVNNETGRKALIITLAEKDKKHLAKFQQSLGINKEMRECLSSYSKNNKRIILKTKLCTSSIYSEKITNDLQLIGLNKNKTHTLDFNYIISHIPPDLINHFIRGFFDGDGCSNISRNMLRMTFTCASVEKFLIPLQTFLVNTIGISKTKLNSKPNNSAKSLILTQSNAFKLFNYLYNNSEIHLDRKYRKAKQHIDMYMSIQNPQAYEYASREQNN